MKSYIPLMSGIAVAVVVIPAMMEPQLGMALAVDRLACTLIGGVCVAIIVGLFTPKAQQQSFQDEVRAFGQDVETEAQAILQGAAGAQISRLMHQTGELEARARLIAAGFRTG
ncbi:FUSC family protein [Lampropedia cohaerens]|uniref:FUSC family protein n=1 Tax=Lampropedia cohaerens TaxID=1610491 RepID=UPI0022B21753|nr:FUSC family protein [Lampropedia cohaerens]